ncbi:hypothetical protein HOLleu_42169 [Holothuria leucospilota]|uniref:Integrase catalytic domain-containing protein n=1 Tax=Holothuria leucospilota TaxID=206669 RepID=A0A9Q1BCA5_HOLLE|nr:hypothetical protein HOLleu_42169 [Holothuria leucospilota]
MSPRERLDVVINHKLCHNCLLSSHKTDDCGKRSVCSVPGCGKKHTKYIHLNDNVANVSSSDTSNNVQVSNTSFHPNKGTHMPLVQVLVNDACKVYALLDSGSSNSFCSRALVRRLGLTGKSYEFQLRTLNKSGPQRSEAVGLSLSSESGETLELSAVYVVDEIPVKSTRIETACYPHLDGLGPMPAYQTDSLMVDLLIGQDNAEALVPLEVRRGKPGEPYAIRTLFGWCVNGQSPTKVPSHKVISNFISALPVRDDVSRLWEIENEGIGPSSWSREDKLVIDLWDRECRKVDGHYELPIPWRDRSEPLPNNFVVAKPRLDNLHKRLLKEGIYDRYNAEIAKLLERGYAEEVPRSELLTADRIWYLPHHAVFSDKKPDKLRVVFDCASKFKGKSLNDRCMQGPDMMTKLLPVLLRFRQHSIAIQADIEAMYNQVKIPLKDRDALRFLWYRDEKLSYYRMTSHLFGGVWCASSSTYALRRTVIDPPCGDPLIRYTVDNSFYVDDCLSSVTSSSLAKVIIRELPQTLSLGGFKLTKFVANDEKLLAEVSKECRAKEIREFGETSESRALGVKWMVSPDEFFFEVGQPMDGLVTRRRMLSIVASIFDPLGLIGPLVMTGKLLFQEATARKLSWDDKVSSDIESDWDLWVQSLGSIGHLKFPRCIKPREWDGDAIELHHFCDASTKGYGCCSYIRCVNRLGGINVQLVISKSKVAPLKACTIPRLELQAAVLAVKVDALLRGELDIVFTQSFFWTDSEIVLKYINNDTRRFHVFVANRVSLIREYSDPKQWLYIESKSNPADLVTRECTCAKLRDNDTWINGPSKLRQYKCEWGSVKVTPTPLEDSDPEVRKVQRSVTVCGVEIGNEVSPMAKENDHDSGPLQTLMNYYSSWYRMKRALAWWIRFINYLRGRRSTSKLSVQDVREAEVVLLRKSQSVAFASEIRRLRSDKPVKVASSLRQLNPFLDSKGLLRVGSRLRARLSANSHPYILSGDHVIATAIIRDAHDVAHVGVEWVLGITRKDYWITKARPLVKRILKACLTCRRLYSKPHPQLMADLPTERVEDSKPPFSYVGIDVFGPFYVKLGRSEVKRYGCLFTCLSIRAIHVEKLDSLDTDTFINAFRRFVSRRGHPEVVFSDNGSNLVSGESEMRKCMKRLSQKSLSAYAVKGDVVWKFNPPYASHMGGVWERMIGVFKVITAVLPRTVRLTDEILQTIFCEVENIVNGRPLTKISDDPSNPTPLTPNHLLLLRNGSVIPPGEFNHSDRFKRRWRHVQHLADQFWRKWVRSYLPELQRRSKWTKVTENLKVGDLVLLQSEVTPRNLWPLALIVGVNRGRDDLVRSVRVKTKTTELVRPITKIVLLESVGSSS